MARNRCLHHYTRHPSKAGVPPALLRSLSRRATWTFISPNSLFSSLRGSHPMQSEKMVSHASKRRRCQCATPPNVQCMASIRTLYPSTFTHSSHLSSLTNIHPLSTSRFERILRGSQLDHDRSRMTLLTSLSFLSHPSIRQSYLQNTTLSL